MHISQMSVLVCEGSFLGANDRCSTHGPGVTGRLMPDAFSDWSCSLLMETVFTVLVLVSDGDFGCSGVHSMSYRRCFSVSGASEGVFVTDVATNVGDEVHGPLLAVARFTSRSPFKLS